MIAKRRVEALEAVNMPSRRITKLTTVENVRRISPEKTMRDILAHASNHAAPTRSMRYAAETAKIFDASLTGIFVSEPIMPLSPLDIPLVPEIYGAAGQITGEAMAYEPKFHQWASAAGVMRHKWRVASAFFTAALASAANWHDVLVLESGGNAPWASVPMLGHALVTCGVPCFVVPESYARPAAFDSIDRFAR